MTLNFAVPALYQRCALPGCVRACQGVQKLGESTEIIQELSRRSMGMIKQDIAQDEEAALLNQLIEQQQVSPIDDLDEVSRLWPADDDPDLLLEYVLNERTERRQLEREQLG
jgi:hypothetical protein